MITTDTPTIIEQLLGQTLEQFVRQVFSSNMYTADSILLEAVYRRHQNNKDSLHKYMKACYTPITDHQISISIEDYIGWINDSTL